MNPKHILVASVLMLLLVSEFVQEGGAIDGISGSGGELASAPPAANPASPPTAIAAAEPLLDGGADSSGPPIFIPDYDPNKTDASPSAPPVAPPAQAATFAWANSSRGELSQAQLGLELPSPTGIAQPRVAD